eukprot:333228-Chlamydomonas_euryale.AAC.1
MRIPHRGRFSIAHQQGRLRKNCAKQLKLRQGHRNMNDLLGCTALQSGGAMRKLPAVIQAAAAEPALDRQAWRDAIKNLAPLKFKKPKQAGRVTHSCARRGGSGEFCATVSSVQPGSRGVLLIQVQAWLCWYMVLFAMIVTWRQETWKLLRSENPVCDHDSTVDFVALSAPHVPQGMRVPAAEKGGAHAAAKTGTPARQAAVLC